MAKLNKSAISTLLAVVAAATSNPPTFSYLNNKQAKPLADAGFIEVNKSMANPADATQFATRPTPAGMDEAKKHAPSGAAASPAPAAVSAFAVDTGVALPTVKRGGGGGTVYPFDTMPAPSGVAPNLVYASFFVPATADKPNPAKSLASTVSSASKRYNDATGKVTRKFVVRSVDETAAGRGKGARVFRTV